MADGDSSEPDLADLAFSDWHAKLRSGDPEFTSQLWDMYFQRMVLLAKQRMVGARTAARDEEDVALSAFKSFCLGVRAGRISLNPENVNLWPLLVTITLNKVVDQIRHENRLKRNPRDSPVGSEPKLDVSKPDIDIKELCSHEPSPAIAAATSETLENMLDCLRQTKDGVLETIAIASIEGNSAGEIAVSLNCSQRTVQRKLKTIQTLWEEKLNHD